MKFEFEVLPKAVPWNTWFAKTPEYCSTLNDPDFIVAVAKVNGMPFARVIEVIATPVSKTEAYRRQTNDEDESDDDDEVPTVPESKAREYYIQHEDRYLTPFVADATSIKDAEIKCRADAEALIAFITKHAKLELQIEDMDTLVRQGWTFAYNKLDSRCPWRVQHESTFGQQFHGRTRESAMKKAYAEMKRTAWWAKHGPGCSKRI